MVDGREFAPGVELGDALGHRPPHAAGAREVVRRAGVVDAALLRGGDHALQRADRLGDVEVRRAQLGDGSIARLLHPLAAAPRVPCELARRVLLEERDGLFDDRARADLVRDRLLLRDHARELFACPTRTSRRGRSWRRGSDASAARRARAPRRPSHPPRARARRARNCASCVVGDTRAAFDVVGELAGEGCRQLSLRGSGIAGERRRRSRRRPCSGRSA